MINTRVDVRPATVDDLAAVNDIYNQFVAETHYTFDIEPMTMDARREWFTHYDTTGRHRLVVAVSDGRVIGYACSSRFRHKAAYETSVETSIYLAPGVCRSRRRLASLRRALRDSRARGRAPGVRGDRVAKPSLGRTA